MSRTGIVGTALLAGLLLAACGSGNGGGEAGKSADQVVQDAVAALRAAGTFHFHADVQSSATTGGGGGLSGPITLDLDLVRGNSAVGTITAEGISAHLVSVGGKLYLQGRSLWAKFAGPQIAELVGDRWVLLPQSAGGFSNLTDLNHLTACLMPSTGNTTVGTGTVDGTAVVVVENKAADEKLSVAASGTAYPLKLESSGKPSSTDPACNTGQESAGTGTFSDFGKSVSVTPPPDPLDMSKLGG